MENEEIKEQREKNLILSNGKKSKDCTILERIQVYKKSIPIKETDKQRMDRINAFRCGW